ncbi:hypothetical protein ACFFX0_26750 [Citricoccus parietis]|uniref:Uncharacterized protein n=1 Tax=Citricoccus parietis TaxID=592307 RepID=A0ABV5G6N4_9MICC
MVRVRNELGHHCHRRRLRDNSNAPGGTMVPDPRAAGGGLLLVGRGAHGPVARLQGHRTHHGLRTCRRAGRVNLPNRFGPHRSIRPVVPSRPIDPAVLPGSADVALLRGHLGTVRTRLVLRHHPSHPPGLNQYWGGYAPPHERRRTGFKSRPSRLLGRNSALEWQG